MCIRDSVRVVDDGDDEGHFLFHAGGQVGDLHLGELVDAETGEQGLLALLPHLVGDLMQVGEEVIKIVGGEKVLQMCIRDRGLEKLRAHGYTAIPVLARDGSYVGTVSEGDFLWNLVDRQDNSLRSKEKQPLKSVMRKSFNPPVSVGAVSYTHLDVYKRQAHGLEQPGSLSCANKKAISASSLSKPS